MMARYACSWFVLISVTSLSSAETVSLVRHGRAAVTIVVTPNAGERVSQAADDLQTYVRKLSGVTLPIRRDGRRVDGVGLYVGECAPSDPRDLPSAGLNPETYAIRLRQGNVLFAGRWPTPVAFAVYSFIEDFLGVRWFAPGEAWEYVPQGERGDLVVDVHDVVKTPDTSPRIWSGHAWFPSWQRWNLRNKTVLSEVVPRRQFQNFLHRVFPPEKYAESHPEFYPWIDGNRWIPPPGTRNWRPCESNPEVLRLTVEYARRWFDEHPTVDSFSLGMDDISHLCGCSRCRAMDPHPDSYEKRQFSDRHYKFVNAVAREIRKTHPDRFIGTLIYNIARQPPETVPRLEDNVFGFITETSARWYDPELRHADHELTREWTKRCRHLSRYDYYGMGTFCPRVYPHTMAEQIKFDKSLGLEGMYTEVYTFLPHTAPMIWALAKLQWDASMDIDQLLGEFYRDMFGKAADTMAQYFDLLERSWNTPRPGRDGWVHRSIVRQALSISAEDCDAGMLLLDRAYGEAVRADVRRRIDTVRAALRYASYAIKPYAISQRLGRLPCENEQQVEEALARLEELNRLGAERREFWPAAMQRQDLLGENLRGLSGKGYLVTGQVSKLEHGALLAALRVLSWCGERHPEKLDSIRRRLTTSGANGDLTEAVAAYLWVQDNRPPNLVVNPGFEQAGENTGPADLDWQTKGAPPGWQFWSRAGDTTYGVKRGVGRQGSSAALMTGGAGGAYLQTIAAKPGERFLVMGWAKALTASARSASRFGVRFRTTSGAWHKRRDLEPQLDVTDSEQWQPLLLLVTIPEGAGSFVVMPATQPLGDDATVLFDDIQVYRLTQSPAHQGKG